MSKRKVSLLFSLFVILYYYLSSGSSHEAILGIRNNVIPPILSTSVTQTVSGAYIVKKVVDGDTIKVEKGATLVTVRLIGVDTPEIVDPRKTVQCFGKEASDFTTSLVEGKTVSFVSDPTQQQYDKYGRLLAYVYLQDGTLVNEKIIRAGYGYEYTYDVPYRYQKAFKDAQRLAEVEGTGLWSSSTCAGKR